jgi:hypothetical protein
MVDGIGQEINIGDWVVHCGSEYADVQSALRRVVKLTAKKVAVPNPSGLGPKLIYLWPKNLVNITSNLEQLSL